MNLEYSQLAALVAVVREGSFDAAAKALYVTPSAISQRIKQLEESVGGVVVVRSTPCRPTTVGESLYRHGLQVELLEKDLLRSVAPAEKDKASPAAPVAIAANADSLATWLVSGLSPFIEDTGLAVEIVLDDEDHTAEWLRGGRVLGAVTTEAKAIQGCRVVPLGVMRYRATATPAFVQRWFSKGLTAESFRQAPVLSFNRKDRLQERYIRRVIGRRPGELRAHLLPSPDAFVQATLTGLGWGMNPEPLVEAHLRQKRLKELAPNHWLDVPLYWQQWSLASDSLDALAASLRAQAALSLHRLA
jgi:LysR family transcriptional regulator (chromosome initiation inhibitor)